MGHFLLQSDMAPKKKAAAPAKKAPAAAPAKEAPKPVKSKDGAGKATKDKALKAKKSALRGVHDKRQRKKRTCVQFRRPKVLHLPVSPSTHAGVPPTGPSLISSKLSNSP